MHEVLGWLDLSQQVAQYCAKGRSQKEAAAHFKVSESQISRLMKASRWPSSAIALIRSKPERLAPGDLSRLADRVWSDIKPTRSGVRRERVTLESAIRSLIERGKEPARKPRDILRILSKERELRQIERQRVEELKSEVERLRQEIELIANSNKTQASPNDDYQASRLRSVLSCKVTYKTLQGGGAEITLKIPLREQVEAICEKLAGNLRGMQLEAAFTKEANSPIS